MIKIHGRGFVIPKEERYIGTSYDTNSESRIFELDRAKTNSVDMSALSFRLDFEYENGEKNTTYLEKEIMDDVIHLIWNIIDSDVPEPGTVKFQIRAFDIEGTVRWNSLLDVFYVEPTIGTAQEYKGDLSEFERMEAALDRKMEIIDEKVAAVEGQMEAEAEAETLRQENELVRIADEEKRVEAENLRQTQEKSRQASTKTAIKNTEVAIAGANQAADRVDTSIAYCEMVTQKALDAIETIENEAVDINGKGAETEDEYTDYNGGTVIL